MPRDSRKVVIYTEGPYSDRAFVEFEVLGGPPLVLDCWSEAAREREATIAEIEGEISDALMTAAWRASGVPRAVGADTEERVIRSTLTKVAEEMASANVDGERAPSMSSRKGTGPRPAADRRRPKPDTKPTLTVVPEPTTKYGFTLSDFMEDE